MTDNLKNIDNWRFKQVLGPKRGSMSEAFPAGLMWKHPEGQVLCVLVLKKNGPTLECWTNVGVGEASAGMKYDIGSINAVELVSVISRLEPTLQRFFPKGTPVDADGVIDPRIAIAPAVEEPAAKEETAQPAPPPPPEVAPAAEPVPAPAPELREIVTELAPPPAAPPEVPNA